VIGYTGQGRGGSRGSNYGTYACGLYTILNASNLARHKTLQSFEFAFARRIVLQKFSR
jgi:hypothetical protein